ncbi:MAG: hypothetical protein DPW09_13545 [Anaerolineae bacterium]|nr:hypothetical protein [Anaerolineales bacterium]MCQ3974464.1 hypothetical protein [Anaerolineae bacterium]
MTALISPFAKADPTLPIREGAPQITRPTKEEIELFPAEAQKLLTDNWAAQKPLLDAGQYNLKWLEGRHILLAGATGPGLGGALETAIMGVGTAASVTVVARDLSRSLGYETGKAMQAQAEAAGWGHKFHWLNEGMGMEGKPLENILQALKTAGAERVVYFNTVAAAISGMLPGMPPVFIKDFDENGLFQWQLTPLSEKEIEITKFVMGDMAVKFPAVLEANGIEVEAAVFADWRGSLDKASRDPGLREYGRQGAYSTSLFMPKDILQEYTRAMVGSGKTVLDIFYPMMRTRALPFIPGGMMMANLNETLMKKEGIRRRDVPELAVAALHRVGQALTEGYDNPFPRTDDHDSHLDEWLFEVSARLNNDEDSDFYYKRWV